MRVIALLVIGILTVAPAMAQQAPSSSPPSSRQDTKPAPPRDLPVSLEKIRSALAKPERPPLFRGVNEKTKADFRVEIRERQKIEELLSTLSFNGGPTPPGGWYAYEQQRIMFPSVDNPLAQPYAAFGQGQLIVILLENLIGKYVTSRAVQSVKNAVHENAEQAARREVNEAIADYCAAQPNSGSGIRICASALPIR